GRSRRERAHRVARPDDRAGRLVEREDAVPGDHVHPTAAGDRLDEVGDAEVAGRRLAVRVGAVPLPPVAPGRWHGLSGVAAALRVVAELRPLLDLLRGAG